MNNKEKTPRSVKDFKQLTKLAKTKFFDRRTKIINGRERVSVKFSHDIPTFPVPYQSKKSFVKIDRFRLLDFSLQSHFFDLELGVTKNAAYYPAQIEKKGKKFFISGISHPTGEGNRLLAYAIVKAIHEELKITPSFEKPYSDDQTLKQNQLEIEYLKSLFISNNIEDISYSGCVSLHQHCCHLPEQP